VLLKEVASTSDIKSYLTFVNNLYKGDDGYVSTQKFSMQALLFKSTDFAKSCFIQPVMVLGSNETVAVCSFIHNPKLPYLFIGLFEAKENMEEGVRLIIERAKLLANKRGLDKIIVGLNGHLTYGVGILEDGFSKKMSFDSIYNKPYYKDYFLPYSYKKETLSTYLANVDEVYEKLKRFRERENIYIREANIKKNFLSEMEVFRVLSNDTIGTTFLYSEADNLHLCQQIKGLKPLLKNENLFFATEKAADNDGKDKDIGFMFWHPDFNAFLTAGKNHSLLELFFKMNKAHKKADTVKINAIGANCGNPFIIAQLIKAFSKKAIGRYKFLETSFIWDNNKKSTELAKNFLGEPFRKYGVYFIEAKN